MGSTEPAGDAGMRTWRAARAAGREMRRATNPGGAAQPQSPIRGGESVIAGTVTAKRRRNRSRRSHRAGIGVSTKLATLVEVPADDLAGVGMRGKAHEDENNRVSKREPVSKNALVEKGVS